MIVTLDGQRLDESFDTGATLQTVIDHVRSGQQQDQVIVSVAIDGQTLSDEQLGSVLESPVGDQTQIDLVTGSAVTLTRDAFLGLATEFGRAREAQDALADRLSGEGSADAIRDVGNVVTLWQTCYRAIAQCSGLVGEDLTAREYRGRPVRDYLQDLIGKLTELRDAFESRDLVLLADLVRYEFPDMCELWQNLLQDLANQLAPAGNTSTG